jgi:CRP/FNR family cyclic AMP-dependent transcriptional regulator
VKERFEGKSGRSQLIEALVNQKLVGANWELAEELASRAQLVEVEAGTVLIEQGAEDTDVYLILTGTFTVSVNGRAVGQRRHNDSVGEMAAIQPIQTRSASVVADEKSVVARVTESDITELGARFPPIYKSIAQDLARRLEQRNRLVARTHERIQIFIMSSVEALPVARIVQNALQYDPFLVTIWTDGVFRVAHYPIESLEAQVDQSDFAVAIAHSDGQTASRDMVWPTTRDNVIFELKTV